MNETIGAIGGHNDQKRRLRIKREQRKKLDEYEEEREIKDLEKKVKKQQFLTLIKVLPIAVVGGTIKTIYDTGKKSSTKKSVSSDGKFIIEENSDGITQLDRDYDLSDSKEEQFIEGAGSKKKIITTPTGEKVVVDLPKKRKEEKKTFFEELFFPTESEKKPDEISVNGEVKENDEEKLTPFSGISINSDTDYSDTFYDTIEDLDIDSDMLPDYMKEKIEKLKSRKIVEEYEKELKDIRYELRNLVYEYSILEEESDNIIISDEVNVILDKLSLIIDKLEELKQKIKIDDISKYDDNYIYTLIEDYLDEFKNGNVVSKIKDSPIYIEVASKIDELEKRKDSLNDKLNEKKEKLEDKERMFNEFKEKYYNIEKINKDLLEFQYEQENLLKEVREKVKNATTVTEKVQVEVAAMNRQSRRLMRILGLQLFLPGPRFAKSMATNTALYLYFLNNLRRPKLVNKKYRVVKVEDYSNDLEYSLNSIDNAQNLLSKTSSQISKMLDEIEDEFKDYLGVIPDVDEVLSNLRKIKSEIEEKEYEMQKIKEEQKKVLEANNNKVLKRGEYSM